MLKVYVSAKLASEADSLLKLNKLLPTYLRGLAPEK